MLIKCLSSLKTSEYQLSTHLNDDINFVFYLLQEMSDIHNKWNSVSENALNSDTKLLLCSATLLTEQSRGTS